MEIIIVGFIFCFFAAKWGKSKPGLVIALLAGGQQLLKFLIALTASAGRGNLFGNLGMLMLMGSVALVLYFTTNMGLRMKRMLPQKEMLLPLVLCAWLGIGMEYTANSTYGLTKLTGFCMLNIVPALFVGLLVTHLKDIEIIIRGVLFFSFAYASTLFVIMISQGSMDLRNPMIPFMGARFDGGIWLGRSVGMAILCLLALPKRGRVNPLFRAIIGVILFVYLVLCGSRGPTLFVPLAAFGYFIFHYGIKSRKTIVGIMAVAICILSILYFMPTVGTERLKENPFESDASGSIRIMVWNDAVTAWGQNLLFGLGTGGFGWGYPHNIFLEFGVENGIIGCGLFIFWLFRIFKKYYSLKQTILTENEKRVVNWSFCVFLYALLNAQVSGSLITNDWVWYGAILVFRGVGVAIADVRAGCRL